MINTSRIRSLLILTIVACVSTAGASTAPPETTGNGLPLEVRTALVLLGGQLMIADKAYEYDRQLSDEIGPRLTGSANYVKATDWAVAEFTRLGLSNVHRESWEIPATWEPESVATARMIAPHEQRLHLESEGWSPSTPNGGVRGNVYYLKDANPDAVKADTPHIENSIVLIDRATLSTASARGTLADGLRMIGEEGARGLIFGVGSANNAVNMYGDTSSTGSIANLPAGNLGKEDTLLIERLLQEGPVEVEFSFRNRIREHVKVDNVVAEIPGREANGEYVLIGAHLDSWQPGTGAQDNGTGVATVLGVAQAIKAAGLTPRRTMRFVLFGGEEEGLLGSIHYVRDHIAELPKCAGDFIADTGADAPKGWYTFGREDEKQAIVALAPVLNSLGAGGTTDFGAYTLDTDEAPFLVKGVPSFALWAPMDKYFLIHHQPSDTFDNVNQRDLNLGVAVVGLTAYAFADMQTTLKHLSSTEVEEELKSLEVLSPYRNMEEHKLF